MKKKIAIPKKHNSIIMNREIIASSFLLDGKKFINKTIKVKDVDIYNCYFLNCDVYVSGKSSVVNCFLDSTPFKTCY